MPSEGQIQCFNSTRANLPKNHSTRRIRQERILLCVPPEHKLNRIWQKQLENRSPMRLTASDLALLDGQEFICLEAEQPMQKAAERFFKAKALCPRNRIRVDQVITALDLAARGIGLCFASEYALDAGIAKDRLRAYELPADAFPRELFIAYEQETYLSDACRALLEIIAEQKR